MTQNTTQKNETTTDKAEAKKPNEHGTISVEGFVKIFDPKTKEIFVEKRA